ncbi:MAG: DNA repair protein RecO [Tagaea sp.]|nr:DNA repair protein RecO [Azospirillum sp.]MCZ8124660.1 DNA repair protein RecO [Magnetospirillum sp.]
MEWRDEAIVLGRRAHGEHAAVATLFSRAHGRHLGLARGGGHGKSAAIYELGNRVDAAWRARLPEHLGNWTCELVEAVAAKLMDAPDKLEALAACAALLDAVLPEREPHAGLYDATRDLLARLDDAGWREAYVRWECRCLADLGFGLDLDSCAATGVVDDLRYVSPKTGRAVSAEAGAPYADRLFALPGFLRAPVPATPADLVAGLEIAGHFLERHVLAPQTKTLPGARVRLYERWRREFRRPKEPR